MVGGDGINGPVPQSGDDAVHVLPGAQGGIDPGQRPLGEHLILGEGEVLRAGLAGEGDPLLLFHLADDVHAPGGGDVADVDMGPGLLRQHGVPHDHDLLGDGGPALQPQLAGDAPLVHRPPGHHGGVLAVAQHRHIQLPGPDEHVPEQVGVVHVVAVIGQGGGSRLLQGLRVGGLLPQQALGHRRHREDVHPAALLGPAEHIAHLLRAVHRGAGVGHAGQGGDPAPGGGGAAGDDILLVGEAGVPQVYVHIHQARADHQPRGVHHLVRLPLQAPLQQGDPSVLDQNILQQDGVRHRMDHPSMFD